ncbi:MAG: Cof-type HAD-IIB family hydrolase [Bacillota bacterium]
MKYKMIVSDLDDTLFNKNREITSHTKATINRYIENGGKFVIATGRMTPAVLPYCYELGLKGEVITYQGAATVDIASGKTLNLSKIENKDAIEIGKYIENRGLYYHIYHEDKFIVNKATPYSLRYARLSKVNFVEINYDLSDYMNENNISPIKMMVITEEDKVMPLISEFNREFNKRFLFNTSKKWMVEVVPIASNKGIAVKNLAKKYGIKRNEIICIGDSLNDLAMIEFAGLGVVVENGSPEAKKAADIIAPSNNDDGVAYIINKYGFLE